MTPPPPPRRRRPGVSVPSARKLGTVRRSQLVTTYGVGAMIAVDNESFMVSGLDSWDAGEAREIFERRLARILKVESFRLPPSPAPERAKDGVRVRRFPEYQHCPTCAVLQPFSKFNSPAVRARCGDCEEDLVPSRFVIACDYGHIDDFPYWKWVHRGQDRPHERCAGTLSLRSTGSTASLRSVVLTCSCGVPDVSMEGAFRAKALKDLGIGCSGRSPWLKGSTPVSCGQLPRAMQRGSSTTWHPITGSALSIPPWGEGLHALVEKHRLIGASEDNIRFYFRGRQGLLSPIGATVEQVIDLVRAIEEQDTDGTDAEVPVATMHSSLRKEEYERLVQGNPEKFASDWQPFVCERPEHELGALHERGFDHVMLAKRLREVRALSAFTRGAVPAEGDSPERHAPLKTSADIDWLPAIEVSGEGVFLRLDTKRLRDWESLPSVVERVEHICRNHLVLLRERAAGTARSHGDLVSAISPRYVLLHTLAHVLINEWSLDGGYGTAALRERLYAGGDMAGLLVYTATSDSAGSLGGLVAQGEPDRLTRTLDSALARASWCSNDPLCLESEGSGAGALNLAACHACVLLPETSCEAGNGFLDRALLVGTADGTVSGFFPRSS
ncbi:DrmB family protein [Streptomyces sp. NPDC001591]|uniref:DrmB family protein n=1 Tax=Streptomyces sp. NPDC001591 TaxID=3364589 RepID=UPI0036ADD16E